MVRQMAPRNGLKDYDHVQLDRNLTGIAYALACGVKALKGYDYILKLDNDVETVTEDIIEKMLLFHEKAGDNYVCSLSIFCLIRNSHPRS